MKAVNFNSKGSGKKGADVFAINSGVQIVREYNPNVSNPNTEAQQNTRGRFKLMSQIAAAMSDVIAIRKDGLKSARNQFVSINFPNTRYADGRADMNLNYIQLTKSNRSFVGFAADRSSGSAIAVNANDNIADQVDRVVYVCFAKNTDGSIHLVDSTVVSTAGANGDFAGSLKYTDKPVVCYAYGIKDLNSAATTKFGNMTAPTAENVAQLLVSSTESMSSVQLTKTAGLTIYSGENTGDSDDVEHFLVSVTTSGNGTASGAGRYAAGQNVTLSATPAAEASFVAWKRNNASGAVLSTSRTYTFQASENITICAVFEGGPTPQVDISTTVSPVGGGTVSGGGTVNQGSNVTLTATPASGYAFDGFYQGATKLSGNATYTFQAQSNMVITAKFVEQASVAFSNVKLNNTDFNANRTLSSGTTAVVTGTVANHGAMDVALIPNSGTISVGSSQTIFGNVGTWDGDNFSVSASASEAFKVVVGTKSGNSILVAAVYDYYFTIEGASEA